VVGLDAKCSSIRKAKFRDDRLIPFRHFPRILRAMLFNKVSKLFTGNGGENFRTTDDVTHVQHHSIVCGGGLLGQRRAPA